MIVEFLRFDEKVDNSLTDWQIESESCCFAQYCSVKLFYDSNMTERRLSKRYTESSVLGITVNDCTARTKVQAKRQISSLIQLVDQMRLFGVV